MDYARLYKPGPMEPVVRAGENLLLIDREGYNLFTVAFVEPLPISPQMLVNVAPAGILASAAINAFNTMAVLDNNFGQLSILRAHVMDDITVQIYEPQSVARFGNKNIIATLNPFTHLEYPFDEPSEVAIFEDQRLFLNTTNNRAVALAQARIAFYGHKYVLVGGTGDSSATGGHVKPIKHYGSIQEAISSGEKFTVVPTGAWGR